MVGRKQLLAIIVASMATSAAIAQDRGTVYIVVPKSDPSPPPKPEEPQGELKTLRVDYPYLKIDDGQTGYESASVKVRYRFIACDGEIHAAYALDPGSVETDETYKVGKKSFPVFDAPPPKPSAIAFTAKVYEKGEYVGFEHIGWVSDKFAGPALGFGCFTGQTQKVGTIKERIGAKATPEQVRAYLARLALGDGRITDGPLRNASLEQTEDQRERQQQAEADAAERARIERLNAQREAREAAWKAEQDRIQAEQRAAREAYERELQSVREAQAKYAADQAAHEAELARARAAAEEYQRQLTVWREAGGKPQ